LKDGFPFQCVTDNLPRVHPVLTKAGKVAKRQPIPQKQTLAWWKAQCLFRGLKQQGKIEDLQNRLRDSGDSIDMLDELRALEALLDEEFRRKNAAAREDRWARLETDEKRAHEDAERFLREKFRGTNPASEAVIIKTYFRSELHAAAERLGLDHEAIEAPPSLDKRGIDEWIIIGPNHSAVAAKTREVSQEAMRVRQEIKDAREKHIRKQMAELASREGVTSNITWDVSGTWSLIAHMFRNNGETKGRTNVNWSSASAQRAMG